MTTQVQFRGTTAEHAFLGAEGELTIDTDKTWRHS